MRVDVTHIQHNCFAVDLGGGDVLVFDYPARPPLGERARQALEAAVQGRTVTVFISHSHQDHFNPDLSLIAETAGEAGWVLSDDVEDLYPDSVPRGALVVEPDEEYEHRGFFIRTWMANDLGVAFLIRKHGLTLWFGGDLAAWLWEEQSEAEETFTREFFAKVLDQLAAESVDLAFSNVDPRLDNLAGGVEFVNTVAPRAFVPMHTFGRTRVLADFVRRLGDTDTSVFVYERPGDGAGFQL
jgi:L-ascorbate metabolism protein UlaG (beta-lactamase superfamily)